MLTAVVQGDVDTCNTSLETSSAAVVPKSINRKLRRSKTKSSIEIQAKSGLVKITKFKFNPNIPKFRMIQIPVEIHIHLSWSFWGHV